MADTKVNSTKLRRKVLEAMSCGGLTTLAYFFLLTPQARRSVDFFVDNGYAERESGLFRLTQDGIELHYAWRSVGGEPGVQ